MSKPIIKTIKIQAGVNPSFLESTLTTDISTLESIFDLIDNSIDAARDHLMSQKFETDKYGLPKNYNGYKISIRLSEKSVSILDNCLGMEELTLSQRVFMTADVSNHKFGIGHYGLGLKRALFKFGNQYAMSSDNGKIAFKMLFDNEMIAGNKELNAHSYDSVGNRKTLFIVTDVKPAIAYEFQSKAWFANAVKMLNIRYAVYIAKGLKISITDACNHSHIRIEGTLPTLRDNAEFPPIKKPIKIDEVDVYIDSGIHHEYYFAKEAKDITEKKAFLAKNKLITNEFGLYFICNDRVIVAASTANEHGWKTKWHSEYNGYVCIVRFVSSDSSKMPWNTIKTALKTDGRMFVEIREILQPIADKYRSSVSKHYLPKSNNNKFNGNLSSTTVPSLEKQKIDNIPATNPSSSHSPQKQKLKPAQMAGNNTHVHLKNWVTLLPKEFPIINNHTLDALILEAIELQFANVPCTCAVLLRTILEQMLRECINKSGKHAEVIKHFYEKGDGKNKDHTEDYKKNQNIDTPMILAWLNDNENALNFFGKEQKKPLHQAVKDTSRNIKKLNGIVHGSGSVVDSAQTSGIRNEVYPLLEFCARKILDSKLKPN